MHADREGTEPYYKQKNKEIKAYRKINGLK
jgi:hypothetical protein